MCLHAAQGEGGLHPFIGEEKHSYQTHPNAAAKTCWRSTGEQAPVCRLGLSRCQATGARRGCACVGALLRTCFLENLKFQITFLPSALKVPFFSSVVIVGRKSTN